MAQMLTHHRSLYPKASALLTGRLAQLPSLPQLKVWQAFLQHSHLADAEARQVVSLDPAAGGAPLIWVSPLGGALWGWFDPTAPTRISLSAAVLDEYEKAPAAAQSQADDFVIAKTLHELCHWACFRNGIPESHEVGEAFENDAFSGIVQPWWNGGAPVAAGAEFTDPSARAAMLRQLLVSGGHAKGRASDPSHAVFTGLDVGAGLPRGYRNNNPGNVRVGDQWLGLADAKDKTDFQQAEGNFLVFQEPEWGLRAMILLLRTYKNKHQLTTPRRIIARWAPASDNNNVDSYASQVANALGVTPDSFVDADDDTTVIGMVKAMARHENGDNPPYAQVQYQAALLLA